MNHENACRGQKNFKELRIVLVGKTGVGKSAAGNTILGTEEFESEASASSVTSKCEKARREVDGREVSVIDTPGLFDLELTNDMVIHEITQCISLSSPGPHVFLVVIQIGRFTPEEQQTVDIIKETFGDDAAKYTMALFTHGDRLKEKPIEQFMSKNEKLMEFTDKCRGGYHVLNNEDKDVSQVSKLLKKIDKMVTLNGGGCYTNEIYARVEKVIEEQKKRLLEEQENSRQKEEEELRRVAEAEALKKAVAELTEKIERMASEKVEKCNDSVEEGTDAKPSQCTIQ